jgi:riboflavin synthase
MFTGIVQDYGTVIDLRREAREGRLSVAAVAPRPDLTLGQSVAVNGVCLTVADRDGDTFLMDLSPETLERTTLGHVKPRERVNLEYPLRVGDPMGGHFVTGHVDGIGRIVGRESTGDSAWMWISTPPPLPDHIAPKGSIAVDGVSLTVVEISDDAFSVCLIPHTLANTTLGSKAPGSLVNLEVDLLSRYVQRLLSAQRSPGRSPALRHVLREQGFA